MLRAHLPRFQWFQKMDGFIDSHLEGPFSGQDALDGLRTTMDNGANFVRFWQDRSTPTTQPTTLPCEAPAGDGQRCGAEALVRRVHYRYTATLNRQLGEVQQVLSEAIYEINCPHCGWRTQVQKVERN
jgi:hypothetical protein